MSVFVFILYDIWWYGWLWLVFIAIAFCSTRFSGCVGILLSLVVIAIIVLIVDVRWVFDEMNNHPENERDADGAFMIVVIFRIVVFNLLLLPVSLFGLRLFQRENAKWSRLED